MQELQAKPPRAQYKLPATISNPGKGYVWIDIPEAEPRCRARLKPDQTASCYVTVDADGRLDYDPHLAEVDVYPQTP
jgi:hypothetical protein